MLEENKILCEDCKITFRYNYLKERHKNRKKSCLYDRYDDLKIEIDKIKNDLNVSDKIILQQTKKTSYKCLYCSTIMTTKSNLKAHIYNNCADRKEIINKLETLNNEKDEIADRLNIKDESTINDTEKNLREEVKSLKEIIEKNGLNTNSHNNNSHNSNSNNNNTNSNNTNTIQIIINNYDTPDITFLTEEQKTKFLKDRYKGILDFIEQVYFNKDHPENHSAYISNLRSKFGQVYKNNKWVVEETDVIADKLNKNGFDSISNHLDDLIKNDLKKNNYKKEIDGGLRFTDHYMSNDTSKISRTAIKKTLYNNRDIVLETKNNNKPKNK
jgi:hypothetical protein